MVGTQRYWDGSRWSEHVAPGSSTRPAVGVSRGDSNLETAGWLTAFFFPIAGVVIGIILAAKGHSKGIPILLVSIAMMVVAYMILAQAAEESVGYY